MKQRSKLNLVCLISLFALVMTACGGGESSPGAGGDGDDSTGSNGGDEGDGSLLAGSWEEIRAAAAEEGELIIAIHVGDGFLRWAEAANDAIDGIEIIATSSPPSEYIPRVVAEQSGGQYLWDMFIGPNGNVDSTLNPADGLESIRPWLDALPDEVKRDEDWGGQFLLFADDQERNFINQFTLSGGTWINRDLAPESELSSPEDLLDPRWRGQFVIYDPSLPNGGSMSLAWFLQDYDEDFLRTILKEQDPTFVESSGTVIEWLVDGRAAIGFGGFARDLLPLQAEGIGESVVQEIEYGNYLLAYTMNVLKNPPNPNAIAVFLEWALSQEGQDLWSQLTSVEASTRRSDVEIYNPASTPDPSRLSDYGPLIGTQEGGPLVETVNRVARE